MNNIVSDTTLHDQLGIPKGTISYKRHRGEITSAGWGKTVIDEKLISMLKTYKPIKRTNVNWKRVEHFVETWERRLEAEARRRQAEQQQSGDGQASGWIAEITANPAVPTKKKRARPRRLTRWQRVKKWLRKKLNAWLS